MNLSREHFRAMILYDFKSSLTRKQCVEKLRSAFGDEAPSKSTVYEWYAEFNRGRVTLSDEHREGRPATAVTPETIDAVREMLKRDNRTTYEEIRASLGIHGTSINTILKDHLAVRKLCSRWIPYNLTDAEKKGRVKWCKQMIEDFDHGQSIQVYDIITGDESWIYCYETENKRQTTQWVFAWEEKPTKAKRARSVGKQVVASFFGRKGHIASVASELKGTVNAEWYHTICLPEVFRKVREKQPNGQIFLHHDNAKRQIADRIGEYLTQEGVKLLNPPTYSPDLTPCDFFLFPKIKDKMRSLWLDSPEKVVEAYEKLVADISPEHWAQCFDEWFHRMQKCIDFYGEYVEK